MSDWPDWTRAQFEAVPKAKWSDYIICNSVVVVPAKLQPLAWWKWQLRTLASLAIGKFLPTERPSPSETEYLHGSGYINLGFVAVIEDKPTWFIGGGSDVIHYDGIGGLGFRWTDRPRLVYDMCEPSGWNVDYLPVSGFFRFWSSVGRIRCGKSLSSFEVWVEHDRESVRGV